MTKESDWSHFVADVIRIIDTQKELPYIAPKWKQSLIDSMPQSRSES
jgi:hypothetical protein